MGEVLLSSEKSRAHMRVGLDTDQLCSSLRFQVCETVGTGGKCCQRSRVHSELVCFLCFVLVFTSQHTAYTVQRKLTRTSRIPSFTILTLIFTTRPIYHHVLNCASDHISSSTQLTPPLRSSSPARQYFNHVSQCSLYGKLSRTFAITDTNDRDFHPSSVGAPANTDPYAVAMHSADPYYKGELPNTTSL
ncbi:hypothetical protein BDR03DRAFT_937729 [Suillus americanus]|nr:hypothetical protein BDR03DRAFT_937729 [Suillus americanus]